MVAALLLIVLLINTFFTAFFIWVWLSTNNPISLATGPPPASNEPVAADLALLIRRIFDEGRAGMRDAERDYRMSQAHRKPAAESPASMHLHEPRPGYGTAEPPLSGPAPTPATAPPA